MKKESGTIQKRRCILCQDWTVPAGQWRAIKKFLKMQIIKSGLCFEIPLWSQCKLGF